MRALYRELDAVKIAPGVSVADVLLYVATFVTIGVGLFTIQPG